MRIYVEDAPRCCCEFPTAFEMRIVPNVLHAAHLLAGLAANLDAPSVTKPAERLEEIALSGRLEDGIAAVEELQAEAARLEEDLQFYR